MSLLGLLRWIPRPIRYSLLRRSMRLNEAELSTLSVKVADTVPEFVEAAKVVHDGYVARGIVAPHGTRVRLTPYLALPSTVIVVASQGPKLVGTMSLVLDSSLGLPLEKTYAPEVAVLRASGRRLAEVGALCVTKGYRGTGVPFLLYKAMWQCAQKLLAVDDLLIAVHPRASDLYQALLCFERFGEERQYPGLNASARALGLRLDLREAVATFRKRFGHLPPGKGNPYWLYTQQEHPQIQLPKTAELFDGLRAVRRQAAIKLAALRPDVVLAMEEDEFQHFNQEMK